MDLPKHEEVYPMSHFVVIEVEPRKTRMASGLELPRKELDIETVMEGIGRVLRVGPGKIIQKGKRTGERIPVSVRPGDRVAFRRFLKDAIPLRKVGEIEYCMIADGDLLAILPDGLEIGIFSERSAS